MTPTFYEGVVQPLYMAIIVHMATSHPSFQRNVIDALLFPKAATRIMQLSAFLYVALGVANLVIILIHFAQARITIH